MDEIQIRVVLPEEYENTGRLTQRANAEYARPGDPLWDKYFGDIADVGRRAVFAAVLVAVAGERIVGTATVELDRTIEGAEGLQPGQANIRLLAAPGPVVIVPRWRAQPAAVREGTHAGISGQALRDGLSRASPTT